MNAPSPVQAGVLDILACGRAMTVVELQRTSEQSHTAALRRRMPGDVSSAGFGLWSPLSQ